MTTKKGLTRVNNKKAGKVKVAKPTPVKSRPLNDELRSQIVHLATRNLYAEELKAINITYYTQWWALFSTANATALNYWCCLPRSWQVSPTSQSQCQDLRIKTAEWSGGGDRHFEARLHDLRDHVKLPANFHGFAYNPSYLCSPGLKAELDKRYDKDTYIAVPQEDCDALLSASNTRDALMRKGREANYALQKLLHEVKTTNQLLEVWPEGERFIPHPPVPVPLSQSLSVDVAALTAALKAGGAM